MGWTFCQKIVFEFVQCAKNVEDCSFKMCGKKDTKNELTFQLGEWDILNSQKGVHENDFFCAYCARYVLI